MQFASNIYGLVGCFSAFFYILQYVELDVIAIKTYMQAYIGAILLTKYIQGRISAIRLKQKRRVIHTHVF